MKNRGVGIIGILFLCVSIVFCGKAIEDIKDSGQTEIQIENISDIHMNDKVNLDTKTVGNEQNTLGNTDTSIINIEVAGEGKEVTNIDLVLATDILSMKYAQIKDTLRDLPSGTPINTAGAEGSDLESLFYSEEISEEIKNRINGKSYGEKCDIPYEELRYLRVLYNGFDGKTYIGELIVNRAIVQDIIEIFRELYAINYPIERMVLVDNYEADDIRSMEANNSSAFNYRFIAESSRRSKHSYGIAIDINPLYNPYITEHDGNTTVLPGNAKEYVDRTKDLEYYIQKGDPCYEAFIKRGFTWGGEWKNSKDYQHFEKELEN